MPRASYSDAPRSTPQTGVAPRSPARARWPTRCSRCACAALISTPSYWEDVKRRADEQREPDVAPLGGMGPRVFDGMDEEESRQWLDQALAVDTAVDDSHPSLCDRLTALGEAPRIPPPLRESAGEALLCAALPALAGRLDDAWREEVAEPWRERFEAMRESRRRLAELERQAAAAELPIPDAYEHADLVEAWRGVGEALPMYRRVVAREPSHAGARFALGRILAAQDDPECLEQLGQAIDAHPDALIPGCQHAYGFLQQNGRMEEAERHADRARRHYQAAEEAREERSRVELDGRYEAHGLAAVDLAPTLEFLSAHPDVKRVWLVRRQLVHRPEEPLFVLCARHRKRLLDWLSTALSKRGDLALQERLQEVPLPGEAFILVLNHRGRRVRRMFEDVPNARILPD